MTAVLVLPAGAPEAEWLKARRQGIGASEIAAVMGISPYDSPFSLWWRKHMGWEVSATTEMSTGTYLEPTIADWFDNAYDLNENAGLHITLGGLFASHERPWQLATPDRLIRKECGWCGGAGERINPADGELWPCQGCIGEGAEGPPVSLLECKWVAYSWDGWGDDGTGVIPVHYRAQVLQQMDVMETGDVFVCALGPGGFRIFRVRRDDKDLRVMREMGTRFMESLADGEPPDVDDHAATLPIVRRLNAAIEDRQVEIPETIATGWLRSKKFKAVAERVEKRYAASLRAHLGQAKTAVCNGRVIAARSNDDKLMRKS